VAEGFRVEEVIPAAVVVDIRAEVNREGRGAVKKKKDPPRRMTLGF
jgi:hypothetical protein